MAGRRGVSPLDYAVAAALLLLLPVSVLALFTLKGWVAYIPLVFIIVCIIVLIVVHIWRMFSDYKRRLGAL